MHALWRPFVDTHKLFDALKSERESKPCGLDTRRFSSLSYTSPRRWVRRRDQNRARERRKKQAKVHGDHLYLPMHLQDPSWVSRLNPYVCLELKGRRAGRDGKESGAGRGREGVKEGDGKG